MNAYGFEFDPAKFVDSVVCLLAGVGPATRMKVVKLLYLADRFHVVHYGTPILGDRYYRLPYGPVPSRALDLLEAAADLASGDPEVTPDEVSEQLLKRVEVKDPGSKMARYVAKEKAPSLDSLAPSEVDALHATAAKYGGWAAPALSDLTHSHRAYVDTAASQEIDYRLFFLDEAGACDEALRYLEFTRADRALLQHLKS